MVTSEASKQRLLAIAAIVVVALLAVNAVLLFNKYSQDQIIVKQKSEIAEADKLKIELEKQYHEALAELEEMRTGNQDLNALIDQQKEELRQQRLKINALLANEGNLDRARAEVKNLTAKVRKYISQAELLKSENDDLRGENELLATQTDQLTQTLENERSINDQLANENEDLATTKSQLTQENSRLTDKVTLASVINVKEISVTGMKKRNNGKLVKKRYAKNVDQLRVCFSTEANNVTYPGVEEFFVRIISPIGETMAIDDLGSGVLVDKSTGDEIRYTSIKEYDYNNDETEICFNWNPNVGNFQNGKYQVEIYNKGHLAGKSTFDLK